MTTPSRPTLCVFSDDWGRHPSSCQHVVRELRDRYEVEWFNTIGTRRPSLDRYALSRAWEKARQWSRSDQGTVDAESPRVWNPRMWPSFRSRFGRAINRRVLLRALHRAVPDPDAAVGLTTVPIVADAVRDAPVRRWVYYCVDDFSVWPGLDGDTLLRMERELVERADAIVAVSGTLVERIAALGREATLVTHGVDVPFWNQRGSGIPSSIEGFETPLVVFWGVVDRRLDLEVLRALDRRLERGTVVLAGPANEPDPAVDELSRVQRVGALPLPALPELAARAAVLVMPYADLPVTRMMQPLKLKEYLATGRPVVSTPLPAVREWAACCDLESSPEAFASRVLERIGSGTPVGQVEARAALEGESWSAKAEAIDRLLRGKR